MKPINENDLAKYNWMGWTHLHHAVYRGDMHNIQLHLSNPTVDVNAIDIRGNTALHLAAKNGIGVKQLLEAGADVHATDKQGNTPLHNAALFLSGEDTTVQQLLAYGADVTACNKLKNTALHHTAMLNLENRNQILALMRAGSDSKAKNSIGCSPQTLARHFENEYFINTLREHIKSLVRVAA
ncbi:MAG: ankyrin repeat domain-containing protein [Coxiellaceae bacterium]|nr:ankyrin repeat domain-containing protein [Coxiellaceae bacterium]